MLKSNEVGLRLPIHHGVRNVQRALYAVCESYDDCIANFQFLIENYVDYNAKYCVNLSSVRRKKILNALKWMKHYLDCLYNVHDDTYTDDGHNTDKRSRLVSDSDRVYHHRPQMIPNATASEDSTDTSNANTKMLLSGSNLGILKAQLSSGSGGISGDESMAESTENTPQISHVTIPTTTGSPLVNGLRLPDATPSNNPNYLGMICYLIFLTFSSFFFFACFHITTV